MQHNNQASGIQAIQAQLIMEELRLLEKQKYRQDLLQQFSEGTRFGGSMTTLSQPMTGSSATKRPLSTALMNSMDSLGGTGTGRVGVSVLGPAPAAYAIGGNRTPQEDLLLNELQERVRVAGENRNLLSGKPHSFDLMASRLSASSASASAPSSSFNNSSVFYSASAVPLGLSEEDLLTKAAGLVLSYRTSAGTSENAQSLLNTLNTEYTVEKRGTAGSSANAFAVTKDDYLKKQSCESQLCDATGRNSRRPSHIVGRSPSHQPLKKGRFSAEKTAPAQTKKHKKSEAGFIQMGSDSSPAAKPALKTFQAMWDNLKTKEWQKELFLRQLHQRRTPFSVGSKVTKPEKRKKSGAKAANPTDKSVTAGKRTGKVSKKLEKQSLIPGSDKMIPAAVEGAKGVSDGLHVHSCAAV